VWFYVAETGAKPFNQMGKRKVCGEPLFFVSMLCLRGLVCRDNREILCHFVADGQRQIQVQNFSEIENKQI